MKPLGQVLTIGALLLTFAGCDDDNNNPGTINVRVMQDGGLPDALPNADGAVDGAVPRCRAFGQLGVHCFPLQ